VNDDNEQRSERPVDELLLEANLGRIVESLVLDDPLQGLGGWASHSVRLPEDEGRSCVRRPT
jgi:hypothetical protein